MPHFPRVPRRLSLTVSAVTLSLVLAACNGGSDATASPTPQPTPGATASPTPAASATASASASAAASASGDAQGGIALQDVDGEKLLEAFSSYGFEFGEPEEDADSGVLRWIGEAEEGDVEAYVFEEAGSIVEVLVADYSAGETGLEELGFVVGLFAPEAASWLIDQINAALEDPGTPIEIEQEFNKVTLSFEAYTDETQSIDIRVLEK